MHHTLDHHTQPLYQTPTAEGGIHPPTPAITTGCTVLDLAQPSRAATATATAWSAHDRAIEVVITV